MLRGIKGVYGSGKGVGKGSANVRYVTLPQNLVLAQAELLESFDSLSGWSTGGNGTLNNTEFLEGTGSLKITSPTAGGQVNADKTVNWNLNGKNTNILIRVYLHSALGSVDNITFYFSNDAGFTNYFSLFKQGFLSGWNYFLIRGNEWNTTGAPSWANPITKLRIKVVSAAGQIGIVSYDGLYCNAQQIPAVLITFDDGHSSIYTKAYPYLKTKKMRGTLYAIASNIGQAGVLNQAQLTELDNAGWSIGNHTNTHTNLTTLTQAQVEGELTTAQGVLDGMGLTRASKHVAYPFGQRNATVDAAMAATGMLTGRTVSGAPEDSYVLPVRYQNILPARSFSNTISLATAKGYIDNIVANKRMMNFLFHILDDSAAGVDTWKTSDFQELVDYIVANRVYVLTIADFYAALSGSISIPQAF